jgi:glycerol-3-phosphate dehydrogenase
MKELQMAIPSAPQTDASPKAGAPENPLDIFVIGGGVNGCAIARDAAGRGLKVALAEKDDLAQATSSRSTKLFHGGLRYLEYGEIKLVRDALKEREILLKAMPHIAWPMRFVLPLSPDMRFDRTTPVSRLLSIVMPWTKGKRPAWMIRAGLWLYDSLGKRELLPATSSYKLADTPEGAPLKAGFSKAFEYSDVWVDDARLVALNAIDAAEKSAQIMTRSPVTSARRDGDLWQIDVEGHGTFHSKTLVNAGGPWVANIIRDVAGLTPTEGVRWVRGSHIITKKLYDHDKAYFLQGSDGRIIFFIPYEDDFTLIGTTEAAQDLDPSLAAICDVETQYLVDFTNTYLQSPMSKDDIVHSYSGVRALYEDGASSATAATREYVLSLNTDGPTLLNVFGGKITSHRHLAEDVLLELEAFLPNTKTWTAHSHLPGGNFPVGAHTTLEAELLKVHPFLEAPHAARLIRLYGLKAMGIFEGMTQVADLGQHFGSDLFEAELRHLIRNEFARSAEDVIWRRTKLGLRLSQSEVQVLDAWMDANVHALLTQAT